ncbi:hypothetical protein ABIB40_002729 [Pedobacter sp. UYP30]
MAGLKIKVFEVLPAMSAVTKFSRAINLFYKRKIFSIFYYFNVLLISMLTIFFLSSPLSGAIFFSCYDVKGFLLK